MMICMVIGFMLVGLSCSLVCCMLFVVSRLMWVLILGVKVWLCIGVCIWVIVGVGMLLGVVVVFGRVWVSMVVKLGVLVFVVV